MLDCKEQEKKVLEWFNSKWIGNKICPICNEGMWNASPTIFEMREFRGGDMVVGKGKIIPIIPITCNNCGYTVNVNAVKIGVVDSKEERKNNG